MKKAMMYSFSVCAVVLMMSCGGKEAKFEPLFNGVNLDGWEVYLGVPDSSVDVPGLARDESGKYTEALGVNNDPLGVFSVQTVDGGTVIRSSGQIYGSLATVAEYSNYHLRLEAKWGEQKWAPREDKPRNAGVLYHGTGDFGKGLNVWKVSHECQVMENMFGDSYRMGNTYCDITALQVDGRYVFDRTAPAVTFGHDLPAGPICSKNPVNEKPVGEWNVIEVLCHGDVSIHRINGKVNMINTRSHLIRDGKSLPLTKGVIQLQSEGAEIFYRNVEIRPITDISQYLQQK